MASRKGAQLHHSATPAVQSDQRRHHGRAAGRKTASAWPWIALATVLLVGGALALLMSGDGRPSGRLTATQQMHDFGQVPIDGGLITTRFPLTVEGETLVTDLTSSWMCTSARLVQADRASNWLGMSHDPSAPQEQFRLLPNQPAYLEVRIDPAAHGEGGLGQITRVVYLKTASGQELEFELTAQVVP